jgi:site-specific DNA recombinase
VEGREERERERIERQVDAMEREVQRLIDAYQVGAIDLAELQERRRRSADHQQVLRRRLGELQQQRREREQELRLLQGLEGFCASIRSALTEPSFAVKQKVLQLVVDRIIVEDTKLVIRHVVPTEPIRLQPRHHLVCTPTCNQLNHYLLRFRYKLSHALRAYTLRECPGVCRCLVVCL